MGETAGAAGLVVPLDTLAPEVAPTFEDVLRAAPLIRIRRNARGQAQPFLRGGDDRQVAVLLDGVPITLGYDHRADLSAIPVSGATRLALTRGPAPLAFGPNVTLGAVEIDVAGASAGHAPPAGARLGVVASAPTGTRVEARTGLRVPLGSRDLDVRAGGSRVDRGGLPVAGGAEASPWLEGPDGYRLGSDVRRLAGFVSARVGRTASAPRAGAPLAGRPGWLSVTATTADGDRGVEPETHVETPRFWRYPEERSSLVATSAGTPTVGTPLGPLVASLHAGVRTGELRIDEFASALYDDVTRTETWDDRTETVRGVVELEPGARTTVRVAGTAASARHLEAVGDGPAQRYRQRLWSGALEASWPVGSVQVDAGVAVDAADTPASGDKPPLARQRTWGARAGLGWSPRIGVRVHAAAARRARFPSLRELYAGPLARFEPNPELSPERLTAVEGGVTWSLGRGALQAVGFHRNLADGIVRVTLPSGGPGSGPPRFQRRNLDLVRSTGVELLVDARSGPVTWRADATLQRVRGRLDGEDRDVDYAPAFSGALALGTELAWGVRGELAGRWESEQTCRSSGAPSGATVSSDPSFDLELRRVLGRSGRGALGVLEGSLRLDNVTDAGVYDQCGLPRPGRTLSVGIRLR